MLFCAAPDAAADPAVGELRVVDGDTLVLGGQKIRLEGIDAPELAQTCRDAKGARYKCGLAAKAFLEHLTTNSPVTCQGSTEDAYGRRIAICFAGSLNLNRQMVEHGQAYAFVRYSDSYRIDQEKARQAARGIWSGTATPPWEYRREKWRVSAQEAPEGCPIKGNISKSGRIYHSPGTPHYARTRINEAAGERWFCSEREALAAGWRAPLS